MRSFLPKGLKVSIGARNMVTGSIRREFLKLFILPILPSDNRKKPMGNAQIQQIPVPTGRSAQCWVGIHNSTDLVLFWNQDINNTVYIGNITNISSGGPNTIPVPPNASFQLPASQNVFVIGASSGIMPLVVIPNAGNMFRGISQGLGNLSIPSIQSPNFVAGSMGWIIRKDGTAEFNGIVVRGNAQFGNGFFSNGDGTLSTIAGLYIYSGVPAAANLIYTVISSGAAGIVGHDKFNNNVLGGETNYQNGLSTTSALQVLSGISVVYQAPTTQPNAAFTQLTVSWDLFRSATIGGGPILNGAEIQDFISFQRSGSGSNAWMYSNNGYMNYDAASGDGNTYILGKNTVKLTSNAPAITLGSFTAILTQQLGIGTNYKFEAKVFFQSNVAAGQAVLSMIHGGSASTTLMASRGFFSPSGGTQGAVNSVVNHLTTFAPDQGSPSPLALNAFWCWEIAGYFNCTASGSVIISGAQIGGGNWTPLSGSFFTIEPVGL